MSLFNIKIKTKNGNEIGKKVTFTVWFSVFYKKNVLTKNHSAYYTYSIRYGEKQNDPKKVLELKDFKNVKSIEDLTLKVILNFCHIIEQIVKAENLNPDFILFMSPDFDGKKNKSWMFLKDAFDKNIDEAKFNKEWDKKECNRLQVSKSAMELVKIYQDLNKNTKIMTIDPNRNPIKYKASISICHGLKERIDNHLQITKDEGKVFKDEHFEKLSSNDYLS